MGLGKQAESSRWDSHLRSSPGPRGQQGRAALPPRGNAIRLLRLPSSLFIDREDASVTEIQGCTQPSVVRARGDREVTQLFLCCARSGACDLRLCLSRSLPPTAPRCGGAPEAGELLCPPAHSGFWRRHPKAALLGARSLLLCSGRHPPSEKLQLPAVAMVTGCVIPSLLSCVSRSPRRSFSLGDNLHLQVCACDSWHPGPRTPPCWADAPCALGAPGRGMLGSHRLH